MTRNRVTLVNQTEALTGSSLSTTTGALLRALFARLEAQSVSYCVLRGYQGLPDVVDHDVDLLVDPADLAPYRRALDRVCHDQGWRVVRTNHRFGFHSWYLIPEGATAPLHIDVWTRVTWRGVPYADEAAILDTRQRHNGFWIPSPGAEAATLLLKELLYFGRVKDKGRGRVKQRIHRLVKEDSASFCATLRPCLGPTPVEFLLDHADEANWPEIEERAGWLRRALVTRALQRRPLNQLTGWLRFLWGHFSDRVLHPSGLFVCLIGPDGSGKTTISRGLEAEMGELFSQVRYQHGHWGLLPELKTYAKGLAQLLGRGKGQRDFGLEISDDGPAPTFGLGRALMYVTYYSLEYFLGHWLIFWAKGRDELVLFDRYFYDYAIQTSYDRVPRWLLRLIEATIPRPDVLIWLRNEPAVIHSRKQELTIPQIRRQAMACEEIVSQHGNAGVAWTDGNPRNTLRSVSQMILACMAPREQRGRS